MTEKDPFYINEHEQPQQNQDTGVPPAADNNVQSINKDVLLVRTAKGSEWDGGGGGAWGAVGSIVAMVLAFIYWGYTWYLEAKAQSIIEPSYYYWGPSVFLAIFFTIACLWIWIPWRTHLPIVFNRSTQKISFWHENELWQGDWKKAEAHTMTVGSAGYGVGVTNEALLSLNVVRDTGKYPEDKGNLYIKIYGTKLNREFSAGKPLSIQAQQIWEYIRLYMNEGMDAVPPPIHDKVIWEFHSFPEVFKHFFWMLRTDVNTVIGFIFFIPFGLLTLFLDICYYPFNRWLPRKAIPPELQATIDARGTTHDK